MYDWYAYLFHATIRGGDAKDLCLRVIADFDEAEYLIKRALRIESRHDLERYLQTLLALIDVVWHPVLISITFNAGPSQTSHHTLR